MNWKKIYKMIDDAFDRERREKESGKDKSA